MSKKSSKYWNYKGIGAVYVKGKTKKGGESWYIWYYDERGKRKQEHIKSALSREDALAALLQRVAEVRQKKFGNGKGKKTSLFNEFTSVYLDDYAKLRKRSWKSDEKYLNAQLVPFFGGFRLSEVTPVHVNQFIKKRLSDGVKGSTINRELTVLKKMLNLAIEWDFDIERNPVKTANFFSEEENRRTRVLTREEEDRLLKEAAPHLKPIIQFALFTGCRLEEILNLSVGDVDSEHDEITIRAENNKTGRQEKIPMCSKVKELLKELVDRTKGESERVFNYVDPSTDELRPITTIRRSFSNACGRAKVQGLQFRDLRRTYATRLHEQGIDPLIIQRLLRHSSFKISEEVYIQSTMNQMKRAVGVLDDRAEPASEIEGGLLPFCYPKDGSKKARARNVLFSNN